MERTHPIYQYQLLKVHVSEFNGPATSSLKKNLKRYCEDGYKLHSTTHLYEDEIVLTFEKIKRLTNDPTLSEWSDAQVNAFIGVTSEHDEYYPEDQAEAEEGIWDEGD